MILEITKKDGGSVIATEVRQVSLNRNILVMYRPFDAPQMQQITLSYNNVDKIYEDTEYMVAAESVFNLVAPERIERVRKPRGYWAVDRCANGACKA
jgi:hypothetical protein